MMRRFVRQLGWRLLLLFAPPAGARLAGLSGAALALQVFVSLSSAGADAVRQQKRCLPFPIFLLVVYALQASCFLVVSQEAAADFPDGAGRQLPGPSAAAPMDVLAPPVPGGVPVAPEGPIKTMTVVIAAHNEHKFLEKTLESIEAATPASVLKEIIVVDDGSEPPLAGQVRAFEERFGRLKIHRHDRRKGLIKSKTEGGNMATGDSIMFLDGHVKPEERWYEPLLRHMNINYKRVVVPLIPILDGDAWVSNTAAVGVKMMFDWTLFFNWFEDYNDFVPCMSGGLFAITRRWWHESGEYDYGMNMWGAENIEQSIRIWLCGGEIYVARDSRVSHVFRLVFPYSVNNTEIYINKVRTVEAWFDDYKTQFYEADPYAKGFTKYVGDISSRLALKKSLHCKPFSWYVDKFRQVFQDKMMLPQNSFLFRDASTGLCVMSDASTLGLVAAKCDSLSHHQLWTLANNGTGFRNVAANKCLDANAGIEDKTKVDALLYYCFGDNAQQMWTFDLGRIRWTNFCLSSRTTAGEKLRLQDCVGFLRGVGSFMKYEERPRTLR